MTSDRVATYYDLSNTTFTWFEQNTDKALSLQHVQLNSGNPTTQVHSGQLARASGSSTYTGSTITFGTPFTGRYLRIKVSSIWGGTGSNQSDVGLSEVRFFS